MTITEWIVATLAVVVALYVYVAHVQPNPHDSSEAKFGRLYEVFLNNSSTQLTADNMVLQPRQCAAALRSFVESLGEQTRKITNHDLSEYEQHLVDAIKEMCDLLQNVESDHFRVGVEGQALTTHLATHGLHVVDCLEKGRLSEVNKTLEGMREKLLRTAAAIRFVQMTVRNVADLAEDLVHQWRFVAVARGTQHWPEHICALHDVTASLLTFLASAASSDEGGSLVASNLPNKWCLPPTGALLQKEIARLGQAYSDAMGHIARARRVVDALAAQVPSMAAPLTAAAPGNAAIKAVLATTAREVAVASTVLRNAGKMGSWVLDHWFDDSKAHPPA